MARSPTRPAARRADTPAAMAPPRPVAMRGLLASQCLLAARGLDCTRQGFSYAPDMEGSKRSEEDSWGHCQQRCVDTQGCQYFSYFPDRGCHVHGKDAEPKETKWKWNLSKWIVSGPVQCEGSGGFSPGVFLLNEKVAGGAGKPLKKAATGPITCPGKFNFEGAGTKELVPTGWHDEDAGGNSQAVEVDKDGRQVVKMDGRAYFAETCTAGNYSNEHYQALNLLGMTMRYTTDISGAGCGCNAALYLVSMGQNTKPSECHDYYCDANNVCGVSCHEIDIQEGNMHAWHSTLHTKSDSDGLGKGYGGGDGWDGPRDFEASEYAPQGSCIDTAKPFQVAVSFPIDENRKLQAMVVVLSQTGHDCKLTMNLDEYEGMDELSGALEAGMTPVVSYWSAPDMLWLDGTGDDGKGPCKKDDVKACPAQVKFYDFVLEEIDAARAPAPAEVPREETAREPAPEEFDRPELAPEPIPEPEDEEEDGAAAQVLDVALTDEWQPQQEEHPDDDPHESPCSTTRTEDCRYTRCCQDAGMQCFEKDEYWATCQVVCEPGSIDRLDELTSARGVDHPASPWSCSPLGERTPGEADPLIVEKADADALAGSLDQEAEEKARVDAEEKRAGVKAKLVAEEKRAEEKAKLVAEEKRAEEKARVDAEEKRAEVKAKLVAEEKRAEEKAKEVAEEKRTEEKAKLVAEEKRAEKAKEVAERDSQQKDLDRKPKAGDEKVPQLVEDLLHEFSSEDYDSVRWDKKGKGEWDSGQGEWDSGQWDEKSKKDQQNAIVMKWTALGASTWGSGAPRLGAGAALLSAAAAAALAGALAARRRAGRRRASPRAYEGLDSSAQAELPGGEARLPPRRGPSALGLEEPEASWRLNAQHHPFDPLLGDQPDV